MYGHYIKILPTETDQACQARCHLQVCTCTSYLCISGSTCTTRCWWALCQYEHRRIWRRHRSTARSCPGRGSWSLIGRAAGRSWCPGERTSNREGPYKWVTSRLQTLLGIRVRWFFFFYSYWFLRFLFEKHSEWLTVLLWLLELQPLVVAVVVQHPEPVSEATYHFFQVPIAANWENHSNNHWECEKGWRAI